MMERTRQPPTGLQRIDKVVLDYETSYRILQLLVV